MDFSARAFQSRGPHLELPEDHGDLRRRLRGPHLRWRRVRLARRPRDSQVARSLAVVRASIGSLMIALLHTYGQLCVLSSLILLLDRLIQGLTRGGEVDSVQTYVAEHPRGSAAARGPARSTSSAARASWPVSCSV